MSKVERFAHKFVGNIPDELEEGNLYVCVDYATVVHLCYCGCGSEVVTPLSPTDWELIFDGDTVSLYPSIGNWNFACRSHYWIDRGRVIPALPWATRDIDEGRDADALAKRAYYAARRLLDEGEVEPMEDAHDFTQVPER